MEEKEPMENTPELDKSDLKLKKHLMKWGVSEEEAMDFIKEHKEMPDDEEEPEQEPIGEEGVGDGEPVETEEPKPDTPTEPIEEPSGEESLLGEEPPAVEPEEQPMEQPMEEQPPMPTEQPQEPEVAEPQEPAVDYGAKFEEQQKTIDALKTRFDSLEQALQKSGIMMPEQNPVGVPANEPQTSESIKGSNDDILAMLNK